MYGVFVAGRLDPVVRESIKHRIVRVECIFDRVEAAKEVYYHIRTEEPNTQVVIREIDPNQAKINNWMNIYYPISLESM